MKNIDMRKRLFSFASKIMDEQQEYIASYVAFIDILAFKTIVRDKSAKEIKTIYDEIRMVDTLICGTELNVLIPQEVKSNLKMTFLSDSIIISVSKDVSMAFYGLFVYCMFLQSKLMSLNTPIICRGAISDGDFFKCFDKDTDTSILFGPCLNEAYLLQEEVAIYPRIIIKDTLLELEKKKLDGDNLTMLNTFIKKCEDSYCFIDYLKFRMIFSKEGFNGKHKIKGFIETQLTLQKTERVKQKYLWLREYYNETIEIAGQNTGRVVLDEDKIK